MENFHKRKDSKDGHRNDCKECRNKGLKYNKTNWFIRESFKIHENTFDYSLVNYINSHTKVKIVCKKHGVFEQTPNSHLSGAGCMKCSKRMSQEDFLEKVNKKHPTGYNFNNTVFIESFKDVEVTCEIHGLFKTTPYKILTTKRPCKICCKELWAGAKTRKTIESIKRSFKEVHGDRYIYDKCVWIKNSIKLIIGCRVHGDFKQNYEVHKRGGNCPKCSRKTGARKKTKMTKDVKEMSLRIRSRVVKYIRKMGQMKSQKTEDIIGCDFNSLKIYLEDNEYGFKLKDKDIDVDHKTPLSEATNKEELLKLFHYTNLQLLPSYYNRNTKRAKKADKNRLENWLKNNDRNSWSNNKN